MPPMPEATPLAVTIPHAVQLTGIGRTRLYEEIKAGRLPVRKSGARSLILMSDLRTYLEKLEVANAPAS
jgi:predicted DNA-binding transcriptional regulator AlpA